MKGPERAHYLLEKLIDKARRSGAHIPYSPNTAYINTIPSQMEARSPGEAALEERIRSYCRWNAMIMVAKREQGEGDLGGHIASFASLGTLIGMGQHHFWHAPTADHGGDLIFFQGHSAPGVYARMMLEGRLSEERALNFRREVDGKGISSYPHPWLMPDVWQFPTVSMGLGPIQAIYQARYLKYLHARGLADTANRKVWAFLGDGETDEPESLGAIGMASREKLDNLIFVINCNLQRLDGPVRGSGKIIQELEGEFRGAGWNVIKLVWGSYWDPLLARDKEGILLQIMEETVDGEYQNFKANDGAFVRKHFFGKHPQAARDGVASHRRGHLAPQPRWPRPAQDLRRLSPGGEPQGPADRDPRQDDQGLRHGTDRRRPHDRAPAEEDGHGLHQAGSATASASRFPTTRSRRCRSTSRRPTHPR